MLIEFGIRAFFSRRRACGQYTAGARMVPGVRKPCTSATRDGRIALEPDPEVVARIGVADEEPKIRRTRGDRRVREGADTLDEQAVRGLRASVELRVEPRRAGRKLARDRRRERQRTERRRSRCRMLRTLSRGRRLRRHHRASRRGAAGERQQACNCEKTGGFMKERENNALTRAF